MVVEQFPQSAEEAQRWPVADFKALEGPPELRSFRGRDLGGRRIVQARKNTRGVTWAVRKAGTS